MSSMVILFWISLLGLFYIYPGYPLLIGLLARTRPRPVERKPNKLSFSIIIACHGENEKLSAKITNLLACREAHRINEILIGLDGTSEKPALPSDARIRCHPYPTRRGKPSVLNDLIPLATGDLLVMMDVRQRLDADALVALAEPFSDPHVGVVSGELVFERATSDTSDAQNIDLYWKLEKWLRSREALIGSVPGATGALYAIRRLLAKPVPHGAALDDVIIPMQAIEQGARCIFEPKAIIYDHPAQDAARESIRKRRTLAGCVQLILLYPRWLLPGGHPLWWSFTSHKIGRLLSPWLLLLAALTNTLLVQHHGIYTLIAAGQLAFYGIGTANLLGLHPVGNKPLARLIRMTGIFLVMQGTLLQAWRDGLCRPNLALWEKA